MTNFFGWDLNSRPADNPDFVLDDNLLDMGVMGEYCIDVNAQRQPQDRCTNDNSDRCFGIVKAYVQNYVLGSVGFVMNATLVAVLMLD